MALVAQKLSSAAVLSLRTPLPERLTPSSLNHVRPASRLRASAHSHQPKSGGSHKRHRNIKVSLDQRSQQIVEFMVSDDSKHLEMHRVGMVTERPKERSESANSADAIDIAAGGHLAFVYGTLKKGFGNHWLIEELISKGDAVYLGVARTEKQYPLVCGPFQVPFLVYKPGSGRYVRGELYRVNDAALKALDVLEGTDRGHYFRLPLELSEFELAEPSRAVPPPPVAAAPSPPAFYSLPPAAPAAVRAEAYFAGMQYAAGLEQAGTPLDSYSHDVAATYVRRKDRPGGRTFVEHVHAWIGQQGHGFDVRPITYTGSNRHHRNHQPSSHQPSSHRTQEVS